MSEHYIFALALALVSILYVVLRFWWDNRIPRVPCEHDWKVLYDKPTRWGDWIYFRRCKKCDKTVKQRTS